MSAAPARRRPSLLLRAALFALTACAAPQLENARGVAPAYPGLDDADVAALAETLQATLETAPSGEPRAWRNAVSGRSGTIEPLRTFRNAAGFYCRDFAERYDAARAVARIRVACRSVEGRWLIVLGDAG